MVNVSPKTQYTVTVTAASSSNISRGVSRMINRNGSGKTHTQFGVVCVRFVFSDVKAPSGTRFVFAHCVYIYITHTHTH